MWYEILPTAGILVAAVAFPSYAQYVINYFVNGNPYRRDLTHRWMRVMYHRDSRIAGDPYTFKGLETLDGNDKQDSC